MKRIAMLVLAMAVGTAGCAASQRAFEDSEASDVESTLKVAGFQLIPSDTPQRIESMRTLPPLAFSRVAAGGLVRFVYADPRSCMCLWVGGQAQMDHFVRLEREQDMDALVQAIEDVDLQVALWDPDWSNIDF